MVVTTVKTPELTDLGPNSNRLGSRRQLDGVPNALGRYNRVSKKLSFNQSTKRVSFNFAKSPQGDKKVDVIFPPLDVASLREAEFELPADILAEAPHSVRCCTCRPSNTRARNALAQGRVVLAPVAPA
jgi:hypothetical protein